jgi:hypothetical protein
LRPRALDLILASGGYLYATHDDPSVAIGRREGLGLAGCWCRWCPRPCSPKRSLGPWRRPKTELSGDRLATLTRLPSGDASHAGFLQLDAAGRHTGLSSDLGLSAGKPVVLARFVSAEADSPAHPYELSGFYITCCGADAVAIGVHVLGPAGGTPAALQRDDWVHATS